MDRELTAGDMADYSVELAAGNLKVRTIRAAYTAVERGWLTFKDHEHRAVAQFNERLVLAVERHENGPSA
jgi:hypothetical protein